MTRTLKAGRRLSYGSAFLAVLVGLSSPAAPAQDASVGRKNAADSPSPLAHRYAALQAQVRDLKEEIARLDTQIPELEKQIDELIERTASLVPPEPTEATKPPPPTVPRKVGYRTPIEQREKNLKTPVIFICEEGRVAIFDLDAAGRELENQVKKKGKITLKLGGSTTFELDGGDFMLKITAIALGPGNIMLLQEGVRKAGCPGETLADLLKPDSRVRNHLRQIESQASSAVIQFNVYPDSYDAFREVRQMVWQKHFRVNWAPMSHGEKLVFGTGERGIIHQ